MSLHLLRPFPEGAPVAVPAPEPSLADLVELVREGTTLAEFWNATGATP